MWTLHRNVKILILHNKVSELRLHYYNQSILSTKRTIFGIKTVRKGGRYQEVYKKHGRVKRFEESLVLTYA